MKPFCVGFILFAVSVAQPALGQQVIARGSWVLESPDHPEFGALAVFKTSAACVASKPALDAQARQANADDQSQMQNALTSDISYQDRMAAINTASAATAFMEAVETADCVQQ